MKGFRARRKAKEQALAQAEEYANPEPHSLSSFTGKSLKRKQKTVPQAKPEFNLDTALPPSNDFRTSLMMPTFSARFSMLREQDDPNTKIGKASDDSVLFPKRASRLNLFAHNPLTDIAEDGSISSTIRPPFLTADRSSSFSEGYASDDGGSMMSRSKPGEGNNLFGGRQKLYRIPVSASSSKNAADGESSSLGGRHMYENDVSLSMFQQLRMQAREQHDVEDMADHAYSVQNTDTDDADAINSPSTGFSKNRGTTSSTTSGPSNRRTSTAATSVASESPALPQGQAGSTATKFPDQSNATMDRNAMLHKRLYGANTDQVSPNRRNFNNPADLSGRTRTPSGARLAHTLSQSRSTSNLGDKYSRAAPVFATSSFRPASPPLVTNSHTNVPFDLGFRDGKRSATPPDMTSRALSPISPGVPEDEQDDALTYVNSVQPNDRGKATAMGLFNRPRRQYDEDQFTRRQLQMHEGRNSPGPRTTDSSRNESRASEAPSKTPDYFDSNLDSVRQSVSSEERQSSGLNKDFHFQSHMSISSSSHTASTASMLPPVLPVTPGRMRGQSSASLSAAAAVKARAESLIRRQNAELVVLEDQRRAGEPVGLALSPNGLPKNPLPPLTTHETFFNNFDASDDDSELESDKRAGRESQPREPPPGIHPAFRDGTHDFDFGESVSPSRSQFPKLSETTRSPLVSHAHDAPVEVFPQYATAANEDSPTLGPLSNGLSPGLGLSGMIHTHMRNDSDKSSIYPPPSPAVAQHPFSDFRGHGSVAPSAQSLHASESIRSDPFEFDNNNSGPTPLRQKQEPNDPAFTMSQRAQQILSQATAHKNQTRSKAQRVLGNEAPDSGGTFGGTPFQQDESQMNHRRAESTETQKEHEHFGNELAERRRKVEDGLKDVVEIESRSVSPARPFDRSPGLPERTLSALRAKTSLPSLRNQPGEQSNKAMKMLGLSSPPLGSTSSRANTQGELWREEEERMLQDFGRRARNEPQAAPSGGAMQRPSPPREPRGSQARQYDDERLRQRSATPSSGRHDRERSNSAHSSRSKSRQGRLPEDHDHPMPGDARQRMRGDSRPPMTNGGPRRPLEYSSEGHDYDRSMSSMSERSKSAMSGRIPSNGRPGPGYPDSRPYSPAGVSRGQDRSRSRPAPLQDRMPQSPGLEALPQMRSTTASPTVASHQQAYQPSYNGRSTPNSNGRTTPSSSGQRKKSISKHMISDPTFVSSTSTVPLVPRRADINAHDPSAPSVPTMNPRRYRQPPTQAFSSEPDDSRGRDRYGMPPPNGQLHREYSSPSATPTMETIPASPNPMQMSFSQNEFQPRRDENHNGRGMPTHINGSDTTARPPPRLRNKLRKSISDGSSLASKAKKQGTGHDRLESPAVSAFPNRSATTLAMVGGDNDGGMF